jgi:hypothetical protein
MVCSFHLKLLAIDASWRTNNVVISCTCCSFCICPFSLLRVSWFVTWSLGTYWKQLRNYSVHAADQWINNCT